MRTVEVRFTPVRGDVDFPNRNQLSIASLSYDCPSTVTTGSDMISWVIGQRNSSGGSIGECGIDDSVEVCCEDAGIVGIWFWIVPVVAYSQLIHPQSRDLFKDTNATNTVTKLGKSESCISLLSQIGKRRRLDRKPDSSFEYLLPSQSNKIQLIHVPYDKPTSEELILCYFSH